MFSSPVCLWIRSLAQIRETVLAKRRITISKEYTAQSSMAHEENQKSTNGAYLDDSWDAVNDDCFKKVSINAPKSARKQIWQS